VPSVGAVPRRQVGGSANFSWSTSSLFVPSRAGRKRTAPNHPETPCRLILLPAQTKVTKHGLFRQEVAAGRQQSIRLHCKMLIERHETLLDPLLAIGPFDGRLWWRVLCA
jgi:hypothetical protein